MTLPPIRDILTRGLHPGATPRDIRTLVDVCHKMAIVSLRPKFSQLLHATGGVPLEDFAFDALGEVFERSPFNRFVTLERWFERQGGITTLSDDQLWTALRRLIFSAITQHLFQSYAEADPSLSRIIRNIKLALRSHATLRLAEQKGVKMIEVREIKGTDTTCPLFVSEILAAECSSFLTGKRRTLRMMLEALSATLTSQHEYRQAIPLTQAALMFRDLLSPAPDASQVASPDDTIVGEDVSSVLQHALTSAQKRGEQTYVRTSKLSQRELECHLQAVKEILLCLLEGSNGAPGHRYEVLRRHLQTLTPDKYRKKSKGIQEYLLRLARSELAKLLQKEL